MKKLLKGLSVLQIVIGVLGVVTAIASLALGGWIGGEVKLYAEQQALIAMKVTAVIGLISAVFNFACGYCGFKGANGDHKKLSAAVKLGFIGLAAALVSGMLTLYGDASLDRICMTGASSIVPILFLISAKSVRDDFDNY